jgi:hypothetical protein
METVRRRTPPTSTLRLAHQPSRPSSQRLQRARIPSSQQQNTESALPFPSGIRTSACAERSPAAGGFPQRASRGGFGRPGSHHFQQCYPISRAGRQGLDIRREYTVCLGEMPGLISVLTTQVLISVHGNGLTHIMWMNPGASVFEIMPAGCVAVSASLIWTPPVSWLNGT